ncbi:hypothetical protein [Streptomyces sp. NPDC048606]|uniref:hypothetical protein n=1 Tax=Streptomyces sp. NPDC048606 TaxID=3154726 RepID=UPI0034154A98
MKLKRMAVVAAAAVVGPTVLMATPAMADEVQNPAVTTPDAAPKEDAAPVAEAPAKAETPAKVETPAKAETPAEKPAEQAPAEKPAAEEPTKVETPGVQTPVVTPPLVPPVFPAPVPAPSPEKAASDAKIAEEALDGAEWEANGPKLTLKDVPSSFTAGTGWKEFTLVVDNSDGEDLEDYSLGLNLLTRTTEFKPGHISLEVYLPDENGKWGWYPVEAEGEQDAFALDFGRGSIEKGDKFDLKLRLKFAKDAPGTEFALAAVGWSNVQGEEIFSDTNFARAVLKKAGSGGNNGGGGNTGNNGNTGGGNNNTKPNGGGTTTPIVDNNGDGTGTGTGTGTHTGGELAETGSDAATTWALGAGGVALAMGAALVAGTGRRRRVTS